MDEVVAIDVQGAAGGPGERRPHAYDYLVLATGATHSYFGHDEWAPLAPGLKSVEDATEIRRRVLLAFELAERQMVEHGWHPPLNFVVIGGGPTGVELAGAISDIAQQYMTPRFPPYRSRARAASCCWMAARASWPPTPKTCRPKRRRARRPGVEVHTGCQVTGIGPGWVDTGGPHAIGRIDAAVTLWAAGCRPRRWANCWARRSTSAAASGRRPAQPARAARGLCHRRPGAF